MPSRRSSGVPQESRRSKSPIRSCIRSYWKEFCSVTPIHGLRYLVETKHPILARIGWILILVVCLVFAVYYSYNLYIRLTYKPTDFPTQTVTKTDDMYNIPFPALTFCDNMKPSEGMSNDTLSFLCGEENAQGNSGSANVNVLSELKTFFNSSCSISLEFAGEKIDDYISYCEDMFTKIVTQHGICFAFNMLDAPEVFQKGINHFYSSHHRKSDWDPQDGYNEDADRITENGTTKALRSGPYPKRAVAMTVTFEISPGQHGKFCTGESPGIKLAIHNPVEMARIGHRDNEWVKLQADKKEFPEGKFLELKSGQDYYIDVDAELKFTNEDLRPLKAEDRNCFFKGERKLELFNHYTQLNCENECLIEFTVEMCQCVDFYMPHINGTPMCTRDQLTCIKSAFDYNNKRKRFCNCHPACQELEYYTDYYYRRRRTQDKDKIHLVLSVTSGEYTILERKKAEVPYNLVDFLANCGGVFGLFLGMSIISLIELGYYGTLRVITEYIRRRRKPTENSLDDNLR